MNSTWFVRLLVLIMMASQYQFEVSNVYVSQHGSDTPSCGTDIQPCKTIAMGVWLAKQHARVYVDGTGSDTTPFSCRSSASEIPGILSNKSLSMVGIHSMVHVNCQEGSHVRFIKGMSQNETIVSVSNFKFINTAIQGQDVSLDVNDCIFNGALQAINLVQSTIGPITLLFTNSLCVNVGSCMAVRVTGLSQPSNRISIGVTNSNVVASGLNSYSSIPAAVAIHVTSSGTLNYTSYTQEKWMACDITLRNVSFQNNIFNGMGIVNVELVYVTSLYAENVFVYNNTLVTSQDDVILNFGVAAEASVYNHTMTLTNVTFLQNKGNSYKLPRAIYVSAVDDILLSILACRFENNSGIMTLFPGNNIYLNIENTIFVDNFGNDNLIFVFGRANTLVAIKDSIFHNNWCEKCDFGMISLLSHFQINVVITNCHFANTPSLFMLYINGLKHVFFKMINSAIIGNTETESSGSVYIVADDIADVSFSNVTFEGCVNDGYKYGGALYLSLTQGNINISSCKFIGNRSPAKSGGAVEFQLQGGDSLIDPGCMRPDPTGTLIDDGYRPYRRWTYNASVVITNTIFANNSAVNGGALSLSGGKYTIRGCTFIDNFAHVQGGHIYSITDSTRLEILDSTFLQKMSQMIVSHEKVYGTSVGLFIYSLSVGPLTIFNTMMKSAWSRDVHLKTLIFISKGSFIDFGDNNQTILKCPRGGSLEILNYTTIVDTEYQSKPCNIALSLLQFNCKACPIDTYSLQHGHSLGMTTISSFKCLPCPFGAACNNKISAKPNYWGYEVEENPSELNFTQCPLGYCSITDANDFTDYNRCLGNRSGTLCGHCKENYSETLLTPLCRHDDECKDYWLLGVAIFMELLMALYLIHKPRLSHILKKQILWFKYFPDNVEEQGPASEDNRVAGSGYLKVVFYFYQVANIILVTTSYDNAIKSYLLQPVIGLFNFQFRLSTSGLLCPFRGLNAVTKQLLFASQVFGVVVMIAVCYCFHRILRLCRSRPPPNFGPYLGAVVETLLLGYAVFAHTSLQLLQCVPLARDWQLFIDGTVSCYQWWQYLLMVFVGTAVVPFILTLALGSHWLHKGSISVKEFVLGCVLPLPYLMYKLISLSRGPREANQEPREWRASVTSVLYGPFRVPKDDSFGAVYWESILIFRRLILIVIYVFVRDPLSKELLLTFANVIILCHHIIVRPFHDVTENIMEMMSLFFLFSLASINTFKASFISIGAEQKGPLSSFGHIMDWIQIIILMALPGLCLLVVLAAIVSQIIRLVIKVLSYIKLKCIRSRDVLVIDDMDSNSLEHYSNTD